MAGEHGQLHRSHRDHIVKLVGIDHVALGSDCPGARLADRSELKDEFLAPTASRTSRPAISSSAIRWARMA